MRTVLISLAAALVAASPALANEARVEARGGVIWGGGDTDAFAGAAAGYDVDLGGTGPFLGGEVSGDKVLTGGTKVAWGFTGRAGAKLGAGKLYANGGYTTEFCDSCEGNWHVGAGYQQNLSSNIYGKVEYRHYMPDQAGAPNRDSVGVGLGLHF